MGETLTFGNCWWVEDDLCSHCQLIECGLDAEDVVRFDGSTAVIPDLEPAEW